MSDTITRMRYVFDEALALAERKNADYGDAWQDQGWRGNLSRVFEKTKRLRTLLWRGQQVPPAVRENVRETAIDAINTLVFFVMNHDAGVEWGHEMPFPPVLPQPGGQTYEDYQSGSSAAAERLNDHLNPETTARLATLGEQAHFGEPLPSREPGHTFDDPIAEVAALSASQNNLPVQTETKPSPNRRQPKRT